jgi:DNA polymerase III subunit delta
MFILLHGSDAFSAGEELDRLRAAGGYDHNQAIFDGADSDLPTIRNTADTLPFLSERRLVVVRGLPKRRRAVGGGGESESETEDRSTRPAPAKKSPAGGSDARMFVEGLAEYAARLPESTDLVVLVDEPLDPEHPLMQAARTYGRAQSFAEPKGTRLEAWLTERTHARGAQLASGVARQLVEAVGENPRLLAGEIEKLATYVGPGGTIRAEDVHALTPSIRELRAFDLTDALLRRDRPGALAVLHELLDQGSAALQLVGLVAYQTRTLLQVKSLADRGLRPTQIAQAAGIAPFVAEKSLATVRRFSSSELEAAHRALLDVDIALKRSRITPEMALDLLVLGFET